MWTCPECGETDFSLVTYERYSLEEVEFAEKLADLEGHDPEARDRFLPIARSALQAGAKSSPAAYAAGRASMLAEARAAVQAERLTEGTGEPDDVGYNHGVDDCLAALDSLGKDGGGRE